MLWELLRYPSEDPHAQMYWRRRLSVLAVAATLLLLVLVLLLRGGGDPQVQRASAEVPGTAAVPSASAPPPSAAGSPPAPAAPPPTCPAGSMALRVASDTVNYAPEQQPVFTLSVVDV